MIYSFNFIKIIRNNEDIRNYFDYTVDRYDTWSLYPTKSGKPKSIYASRIIELRKQFIPFCGCEIEEPEINEIVDMEENPDSSQDYIYEWHFAHRHNFPSNIKSSGRGQSKKFYDIYNHPLSYLLMCNVHHEEYDRENGEWRNPKNRKNEF